MNKYKEHFKTIMLHKKWVFYYCRKFSIPFRGLVHDLSKFSPTEFFESAKYYQGNRSPIDACKEVNGYSNAWFHHRGRNKHHWEYWVDNFEKGMQPVEMPKKYLLEMFCDFLGAGKVYNKDKNLTDHELYRLEYEWWTSKRKSVKMHPSSLLQVDKWFDELIKYGTIIS